MKTLYLECGMGAAGDMLMAALLELDENPADVVDTLNGLGLPGVEVAAEPAVRCGITGTHVAVRVNGVEEQSQDVDAAGHPLFGSGRHHHGEAHHHHHKEDAEQHHHHGENHTHGMRQHSHEHGHRHSHAHTGLPEIEKLLEGLPVSNKVKADALAVYRLIAGAEAAAHGRPVDQVHFHEVGNLDAVADVVGVCLLIERLAPEVIIASPVRVGSGFVRCAHGVLPVPAPATAYILRDVPSYAGDIAGEMCTPTGAALLKHFAGSYGPQPVMKTRRIGYGMGSKVFETANCLRAFWGEGGASATGPNGQVAELRCNLDDMTGEALAFACERLLEAGALDVFTQPLQMKKGRPGQLVTCLCPVNRADEFAALLLRHTTTFGVRRTLCDRYTLDRESESLQTENGPVRLKTGKGYGTQKTKPEYEDLAAAARKTGKSLPQIAAGTAKAAEKQGKA